MVMKKEAGNKIERCLKHPVSLYQLTSRASSISDNTTTAHFLRKEGGCLMICTNFKNGEAIGFA